MKRHIKWFKVANCAKEIFGEHNNLTVAESAGKKITLARFGKDVFACAHKCPHAGGILSEGFIDAKGNIVCPMHEYKFNLTTGKNVSGEGYYLKLFPIEEKEAGLFIGVEESNTDGV